MDDLNDQEIALLAVATRRWRMALDEAITGKRGPISEALRAIGITLPGEAPESVMEAFFWDGVAAGLKAAHSEEARSKLLDSAFKFPGFENR